jgi:hypothetical protein
MQGKSLAFLASFGKAAGKWIDKMPKPFAPNSLQNDKILYLNAGIPVISAPVINKWMSCVPS